MAQRKKSRPNTDAWVLPVSQIKRQLGRIPCVTCSQLLSTTKSWAIELHRDAELQRKLCPLVTDVNDAHAHDPATRESVSMLIVQPANGEVAASLVVFDLQTFIIWVDEVMKARKHDARLERKLMGKEGD